MKFFSSNFFKPLLWTIRPCLCVCLRSTQIMPFLGIISTLGTPSTTDCVPIASKPANLAYYSKKKIQKNHTIVFSKVSPLIGGMF